MVRLCNWSYRQQHGCILKKQKESVGGIFYVSVILVPLPSTSRILTSGKIKVSGIFGVGGGKGSKIHRIYCVAIEILLLCSQHWKKKKERKQNCMHLVSLPPPSFPPSFSDMHVNSSASVQRVAQSMDESLLEQQLRCSQRVSNRPTICWRILLFSQPASVSFSNERRLQCIVKTIHSSSQRMCHLECSPDPLEPPELAQAEWTRPMLIQYRIK